MSRRHDLINNIKAYLGLDYIFFYPPENEFGIIVDNIHKHPLISKLLCKIGRHDYEYAGIQPQGVLLQCFRCMQTKDSMPSVSSNPRKGIH